MGYLGKKINASSLLIIGDKVLYVIILDTDYLILYE